MTETQHDAYVEMAMSYLKRRKGKRFNDDFNLLIAKHTAALLLACKAVKEQRMRSVIHEHAWEEVTEHEQVVTEELAEKCPQNGTSPKGLKFVIQFCFYHVYDMIRSGVQVNQISGASDIHTELILHQENKQHLQVLSKSLN